MFEDKTIRDLNTTQTQKHAVTSLPVTVDRDVGHPSLPAAFVKPLLVDIQTTETGSNILQIPLTIILSPAGF